MAKTDKLLADASKFRMASNLLEDEVVKNSVKTIMSDLMKTEQFQEIVWKIVWKKIKNWVYSTIVVIGILFSILGDFQSIINTQPEILIQEEING